MSIDIEAWLESAASTAARRITLPPEERWVPVPKRTSASPWPAVLVVATLIIAIVISVRAATAPGSRVASGGVVAFTETAMEAAVWKDLRTSTPAWVPLLRPSALPVALITRDERCGDPTVTGDHSVAWGEFANGVTTWDVTYHHSASDDACPGLRILLSVLLDTGVPILGNLREPRTNERLVRSVTVRGVPADLRVTETNGELHVVFQEGMFVYRVSATGVSADDLVRVAQSLRDAR